MILHNVTIAENNKNVNVKIVNAKIEEILPSADQSGLTQKITFTNAVIFPGLINSHDHLDFNLFPQLGDQTYLSYTAWGNYIHQSYAAQIEAILKIPTVLRESWGIYKNLLCGVTTVVNHGEKLKLQTKLINVLENDQSIHSVQFEKRWKYKLNNPFHFTKNVVIHIGEGTDKASQDEVGTLIKWNLLKRSLIGIHGLAVKNKQANSFKAIVWCPESNQFLLNSTANIKSLKKHTKILFGTDSTLTGNWNIWKHIRMARKTQMLTDLELYHSLNIVPADIWKNGAGHFEKGADADFVIARRKNNGDSLDAFFNTDPEDILLVMQKGKVLLFDESLKNQLSSINFEDFCKIYMNGSSKYVIGDLHGLMDSIKKYQPDAAFPNELVHL